MGCVLYLVRCCRKAVHLSCNIGGGEQFKYICGDEAHAPGQPAVNTDKVQGDLESERWVVNQVVRFPYSFESAYKYWHSVCSSDNDRKLVQEGGGHRGKGSAPDVSNVRSKNSFLFVNEQICNSLNWAKCCFLLLLLSGTITQIIMTQIQVLF